MTEHTAERIAQELHARLLPQLYAGGAWRTRRHGRVWLLPEFYVWFHTRVDGPILSATACFEEIVLAYFVEQYPDLETAVEALFQRYLAQTRWAPLHWEIDYLRPPPPRC